MRIVTSSKIVAGIVILLLQVNSLTGQKTSKVNPPARTELEVAIDLDRKQDARVHSGVLDIGTIPVDKELFLKLTMRNKSDRQIQFTGVSKKCSCSTFKSKSLNIPAGGETTAEIKIKAPARRKSTRSFIVVNLVNVSRSVVRMEFQFDLSGLLGFAEFLGTLEFKGDEKTKSIDVPLLITSPMTLERFEVEASENLGNPKFEKVTTAAGPLLRVTVSEEILGASDVRGEIFVHCKETGQQDCYYLIVKNERTVEISPKTIQLSEKNGKWSGSALIKLPERIEKGGSEHLKVVCRCGENSLKTSFKVISDRLIKVSIDVGENEENVIAKTLGEQNGYLDWLIDMDGSETEFKTPFVLDK